MKYHIERWTGGIWKREITGLTEYGVAMNMKRTLADKRGEDQDNYSILVEVTE